MKIALLTIILILTIVNFSYAEKIINNQIQEAEITFTTQEAQAAIGLFDLATKSGGLQVAEAAVILTKKFQEAFKMKPPIVKEETENPK